jgi:hypothetical protein
MPLIYATRQQLLDYTPAEHKTKVPAEPEATRLLTAASKEVLLATRTAIYATDTDGYPTASATLQALRDATCAQALWWAINPGEETGTADEYDSVAIGSVHLSKKSGSGARNAGLAVGGSGRLCPQAATELALGGLSPGHVSAPSPYWGA